MTMFILTDGRSESFPAVGKQYSWSSENFETAGVEVTTGLPR
jgi:hypothetical protein